MRAATLSPAIRRKAAICSATVQHTPGIVTLTRGPSLPASRPAAWIRNPTAARGLACQCSTLSSTGSTASCPASGSRIIDEKKPDAALFGRPGADDARHCREVTNAGRDGLDRAAEVARVGRRVHINERKFADRPAIKRAVIDEPRRQLASDHAGGADNQNVHCPSQFPRVFN